VTSPRPRFAVLDRLPPALYSPVVLHLHGELADRAEAVVTLREALLEGRVPDTLPWPAPLFRDPFLQALRDARIAELCADDPTGVDELVLYVLHGIGETHQVYERSLVAFLALADREAQDRILLGADPGNAEERRERAVQLATDMSREQLHRHVMTGWRERAAARIDLEESLARIFEPGGAPGRERGWLHAVPLEAAMELRRILGTVGRADALIHALGGRRADESAGRVAQIEVERERPRAEVTLRPEERDGVGAIRGVERTGELARMLPSEAALLGHPALRMLWHVRRAERALLGYHAVGVMSARIQTEASARERVTEERTASQGPILLMVDTSDSMVGLPEDLARAVALQIVGTAHAERRPCLALLFGTRDELEVHELTFDGAGLTRAIEVLAMGFGGGTQPEGALHAATQRANEGFWRNADLVVVSDGEFACDPHTLARLQRIRAQHGMRIHGVRVGPGLGFEALGCVAVHDIADWMLG